MEETSTIISCDLSTRAFGVAVLLNDAAAFNIARRSNNTISVIFRSNQSPLTRTQNDSNFDRSLIGKKQLREHNLPKCNLSYNLLTRIYLFPSKST